MSEQRIGIIPHTSVVAPVFDSKEIDALVKNESVIALLSIVLHNQLVADRKLNALLALQEKPTEAYAGEGAGTVSGGSGNAGKPVGEQTPKKSQGSPRKKQK